ncbi:uncharacterized protein B0P05DRAFT_544690 [Gilbertella persicaria]|uniref:uncharacterized protein n=1 Tax=Gilbertella persicaria TaxID=101096 RepID=UPI00221E46E8|nr:uncharacterized protein B0P05DRAFT_544690 [Gilbertella persicaria]KAI8077347.1 hypothetical protein B0P05DRAFT_544690 [Gilbertella persicaria]
MSLLLTKTCEYAILISLQQGRHFKGETIKIETELDLKLPPSIDDLIPQKTSITTPPTKIDPEGNCSFNISLVYYVSFKQLTRLRKLNATITLKVQLDHHQTELKLSMSDAKEVVPQSGHKLDQIYKFVSDKGSWCTLADKQQLKVGLFYVAMPDTNTIVANTPSMQLRSPPPTPMIPSTNKKKKKTMSSILGANNKKKKTKEPPVLRRTTSSLVDLNIEELADALKKVNLFQPTPSPSLSLQQQSYHQIGKGSSQYTFYFRIMYADHIKSVLKDSPKRLKKPFISYTFLTHYTLVPAASISTSSLTHIKSCYQFRGHLVDIQDWLDDQDHLVLDYVLMDKWSKQTMGKSHVSLKGIAFTTPSDRSCPVYNQDKEILATITVRIRLVSGWHTEEAFGEDIRKRSNQEESLLSPTMVDAWDMLPNKRHHSQSSVPTLLTSSTSTQSSRVPPSIHLVRPTSEKRRKTHVNNKYHHNI